jgi:hypothetical protein
MLREMLHFQLWSHEQYQGLLWIPPSTFVIAKILSQSQDNYCLAVWKSRVYVLQEFVRRRIDAN